MEPPKIYDVNYDVNQNLSTAQKEKVQALGRKWEKKCAAGDVTKCEKFIRRVIKYCDRDVFSQFCKENDSTLNGFSEREVQKNSKDWVMLAPSINDTIEQKPSEESELAKALNELHEIKNDRALYVFLDQILDRSALRMEAKLEVFYRAPEEILQIFDYAPEEKPQVSYRQPCDANLKMNDLCKKFTNQFGLTDFRIKSIVEEWSDQDRETEREQKAPDASRRIMREEERQYRNKHSAETRYTPLVRSKVFEDEGRAKFDSTWNYLITLQSSRLKAVLEQLHEIIKGRDEVALCDFLNQILDREDLRTEEKLQILYRASPSLKYLIDVGSLKDKFMKQFCLRFNDFQDIVKGWNEQDAQLYREIYPKCYFQLLKKGNSFDKLLEDEGRKKLEVALNYFKVLHSQKP